MKNPWFAFYPSDFVASTADMDAESLGGYMRLLCYQWQRGSIPPDDATMTRIAGGISASSLACIRARFTVLPDGNLQHPRMEQEREKTDLLRSRRSAGAAATNSRRTLSAPLSAPLSDTLSGALSDTLSGALSAASHSHSHNHSLSLSERECERDWKPSESDVEKLVRRDPVMHTKLTQCAAGHLCNKVPIADQVREQMAVFATAVTRRAIAMRRRTLDKVESRGLATGDCAALWVILWKSHMGGGPSPSDQVKLDSENPRLNNVAALWMSQIRRSSQISQ
jgi:uncharacterized protein YdaU (DUF1376 family)